MTIGERIQLLRKAAGLSQEQLAEIVGVSRQAVSKWETDQSSPDIENILALSRAFSVSTDELLGSTDVLSEGGASSLEPSRPQMDAILRLNMKKRLLTVGWISVLAGLVLLIVEYFLLFTLQHNEMVYLNQWNPDALTYASQPPLPTIFFITAVIIAAGICLTAAGLTGKKK